MIPLMLPLLACAFVAEAAPAEWRYVVPKTGEAFESPPPRLIALSKSKPDDVVEMVEYRGKKESRLYAQIRYGSANSVRATAVVNDLGDGRFDLYLDADRNRRIEAKDLVAGEGRSRRVKLDVAIVDGDSTRFVPRLVSLRVGGSGRTLSASAVGYVEGTVAIEGREHKGRRTDGDCDGFFSGPDDRVWFDLNDDGIWDALAEQFPLAPIMNLAGTRYRSRTEFTGTSLALEPIEGTGMIQLSILDKTLRKRILSIDAMLVAHDGSAVAVRGLNADVVAPIGEYRFATLVVSLADPEDGLPWNYVFSDSGYDPSRKRVWHSLARDGSLASIRSAFWNSRCSFIRNRPNASRASR